MRNHQQIFVIFLTLLFTSSAFGQLAFRDVSDAVGTIERGGQNIGISFCDYNNDNQEDFYVVCRTGPNHFYKNEGNGVFTERSQEMGLNFLGNSRTAVWGDLNNDGFEDVYVGNMNEPDVLYQNNGDGTFNNITQIAGIDNDSRVFSVNMVDVNQDGWLDIYISNSNSDNVLYLNHGASELSFSNYTAEAGLKDTRHCMGVVFFDMDNDGDEDLYVTHDANIPNTLYKNDGTGHFTEMGQAAGVDFRGFGMGVDAGDLDNDGDFDLYVTNLYDNVLYINQGDGTFKDFTEISDVGDIGMGWGASIFDFDNDGLNDIYIGNDSYFYPLPNLLYENKGNYKFVSLDETAVVSSMQGTYGVATGDLNNDGTQDLALANIGSKDNTQILQNELDAGYWIGFKLEGVESNRSAIGTRIEIKDNRGDLHIDQVMAGNGYAGQNSKRIHFGFGNVGAIQSIKIIWPSGLIQKMDGLDLGQYYSVIEGQVPTKLAFGVITSTSEILTDNFDISVFPNPTSQVLQVTLPVDLLEPFTISLVNSTGQVTYQQANIQGPQLSIDLAGKKGVFELIIEGEGILVSRKVLVF